MKNARKEAAVILRKIAAALPAPTAATTAYLHGYADALDRRRARRRPRP